MKRTLGVESSLLSAVVWVAEDQGYYQEEGLDLEIKEFSSGKASFLAMLQGEDVDISTVAPTPIMFNSFERHDFSVFATFAHSYDDVKVIARKDRGIKRGLDLEGKKIGTPSGTTGQFFLGVYLTFNGLLTSDVEVIDIKPPDLPNALENNQVDAIVVWEPHAYRALELLQDKAIRLPSSEVYRETFNFMVMNDFSRKNQKKLKRFLRANLKATEFIKNHKEEAQDIVANKLNLDKKVIAKLWDDFVFKISLDQSLLTTLEDEARWAISNRFTNKTQIPDYLNFIIPGALNAVSPESVTVIYEKEKGYEN